MAENKPEVSLEEAIDALYRLGMLRFIPRNARTYFSKQGLDIENGDNHDFMCAFFIYDGRRLD